MSRMIATETFSVKVGTDENGNDVMKEIKAGEEGGLVSSDVSIDKDGSIWVERDSTVSGTSDLLGDVYVSDGSRLENVVVENSVISGTNMRDGAEANGSSVTNSEISGHVTLNDSSVSQSNVTNAARSTIDVTGSSVNNSSVESTNVRNSTLSNSDVSSDRDRPTSIYGSSVEGSELRNVALSGGSNVKDSSVTFESPERISGATFDNAYVKDPSDYEKLTDKETPDGMRNATIHETFEGGAVVSMHENGSERESVESTSPEDYCKEFAGEVDADSVMAKADRVSDSGDDTTNDGKDSADSKELDIKYLVGIDENGKEVLYPVGDGPVDWEQVAADQKKYEEDKAAADKESHGATVVVGRLELSIDERTMKPFEAGENGGTSSFEYKFLDKNGNETGDMKDAVSVRTSNDRMEMTAPITSKTFHQDETKVTQVLNEKGYVVESHRETQVGGGVTYDEKTYYVRDENGKEVESVSSFERTDKDGNVTDASYDRTHYKDFGDGYGRMETDSISKDEFEERASEIEDENKAANDMSNDDDRVD